MYGGTHGVSPVVLNPDYWKRQKSSLARVERSLRGGGAVSAPSASAMSLGEVNMLAEAHERITRGIAARRAMEGREARCDVFRHVFTTFRMRPDWDGTVQQIGPSGTVVGSIDPLGTWRVNPDCKPDGTLETGRLARGIRNWGLRFNDWLPVRADETATEFDKELRRPVVLIQLNNVESASLRWAHVHRPPGPGSYVRMLDKSLGIEVNSHPNHLIALGAPVANSDQPISFETRSTNIQPQFDYRTLLATVALRTDDRLRVEETISTGDPSLTLRITVDEAEAWYVVPGTVMDINADGSLKFTAGGEVRNDRRRLAQVMSLCKTWYGTIRQRMTCTVGSIEPGYEIGDVIKNLVERTAAGNYGTVLNTPITSKVIDLENQTTTWRTDFAELDVSMAARVG